MKRLTLWLPVLLLLLLFVQPRTYAAVVPKEEVLFASTSVTQAMEEIETRFSIQIIDQTGSGLSLAALRNLETALNYISFDLFDEVVSHFKDTFGASLEICFVPYLGQSYIGQTSLFYGPSSAVCSVEFVDSGDRFTSSGLSVDTMIHEFCHLINYAMLDIRGNNPVEAVFLPLNGGISYQESYVQSLTPESLSWQEYLASLNGAETCVFADDYSITNAYEDFASLLQVIALNSSVWEVKLQAPENAALLAKYRRAVSLIDQYFKSGDGSPLTNLLPASWATEDWAMAKELALIPDSLDHDYTQPITRLEFCRLIAELLSSVWGEDAADYLTGLGYELMAPYSDCSDEAVQVLTALGIIEGRGDGCFDPNASLTRQEAAKILTLTAETLGFGAKTDTAAAFPEQNSYPVWSRDYITQISAMGIMNGGPDGSFSPNATYDRQQSFVTIYRLYAYITETGKVPAEDDPQGLFH